MDWLNEETVEAVNQEGHELEEHLLWELNVRELLREEMDKERERIRHAPPDRCESAESVGWACQSSHLLKQTRQAFEQCTSAPNEAEQLHA